MRRTVLLFAVAAALALVLAVLPAAILWALLLWLYALPDYVAMFWTALTHAISAVTLWIVISTAVTDSEKEE